MFERYEEKSYMKIVKVEALEPYTIDDNTVSSAGSTLSAPSHNFPIYSKDDSATFGLRKFSEARNSTT